MNQFKFFALFLIFNTGVSLAQSQSTTTETVVSPTVKAPMIPSVKLPPTMGPVAEACKAEIEKSCSGKKHEFREIRYCLEANKATLSEVCLKTLEATGRGKGMGRNK
jgi:hypothetical protein